MSLSANTRKHRIGKFRILRCLTGKTYYLSCWNFPVSNISEIYYSWTQEVSSTYIRRSERLTYVQFTSCVQGMITETCKSLESL